MALNGLWVRELFERWKNGENISKRFFFTRLLHCLYKIGVKTGILGEKLYMGV